jgi:hypothetical protein
MTIGFLFWLIFVLYFILGGYWGWESPPPERRRYFGSFGFVLVLIFLLGWKSFGFVIQG